MSTTRPVIGPVPPKEIYLCWVKRSLLRQGLRPGAVDGADTPAYRAAVRTFRRDSGLGDSDTVDPVTQDHLVRLNHADEDYARWVQAALVRGGLLAPGIAKRERLIEQPQSLTRAAIRQLQRRLKLDPDGWVGPKTERELHRLGRVAAPDRAGRPAPCLPMRSTPRPPPPVDDAQLQNLLRNTEDWMSELGALHEAELCLVRKLLDPRVSDQVPQLKTFFDSHRGGLDVPTRSLRAAMKRRIAALRAGGLVPTPQRIAGWLGDALASMRDEVVSAWKVDCTLDASSRARHLVDELSRNRNHVFSCPGVRRTVEHWMQAKGYREC